MTKPKFIRTVSSVSAGLVLAATVGVAGATRGHHDNGYKRGSEEVRSVKNDNDVALNNETNQVAQSGDAEVYKNDKKRRRHGRHDYEDKKSGDADATTGNASNKNDVYASVNVTNDDCGCVEGASDSKKKKSMVKINNDNDVVINNQTNQKATSGDATVEGEGSATTGNASNSNKAEFSVSISN